jgi:hypothetical protein
MSLKQIPGYLNTSGVIKERPIISQTGAYSRFVKPVHHIHSPAK